MRDPEINATGSEFAIVTSEEIDLVHFDQVRAVIAYMVDELTTDLVCCDIVTRTDDGEQILTIHEELTGFGVAMDSLASLAGFDQAWREAVVVPPFATNRKVLYTYAVDN